MSTEALNFVQIVQSVIGEETFNQIVDDVVLASEVVSENENEEEGQVQGQPATFVLDSYSELVDQAAQVSDEEYAESVRPLETEEIDHARVIDNLRVNLLSALASSRNLDLNRVRTRDLIDCVFAMAANNEQVQGLIDFLESKSEEVGKYVELINNSTSGLRDNTLDEIMNIQGSHKDFFIVLRAKLDGIVEFKPENFALLAGSDSPIIKTEFGSNMNLTSLQAYFISDICAMYASYILTCSADMYANGEYEKMDDAARTEMEHINVHCLSVLGVNSAIHRRNDYEKESAFSCAYANASTTADAYYLNRLLFSILMGLYRGTLAGDIFDWISQAAPIRQKVVYGDGNLPSVSMVDDGMRRLTCYPATWQAMINVVAPFSVYPMISESIDMASYLMLDNYKKTKTFSFSLLTMQATMFSYLMRNDNDLSVLGTLSALAKHIDSFVGREIVIKVQDKEVTSTETTILSNNASKLLATLYGYKLPEFKAANPHVMFA